MGFYLNGKILNKMDFFKQMMILNVNIAIHLQARIKQVLEHILETVNLILLINKHCLHKY